MAGIYKPGGRFLIDLNIEGSIEGGELQPIRVKVPNGVLNPEIVRRLKAEYDRKKWRYVIENYPAGT